MILIRMEIHTFFFFVYLFFITQKGHSVDRDYTLPIKTRLGDQLRCKRSTPLVSLCDIRYLHNFPSFDDCAPYFRSCQIIEIEIGATVSMKKLLSSYLGQMDVSISLKSLENFASFYLSLVKKILSSTCMYQWEKK